MGTNEDKEQAQGRLNPVQRADKKKPYPSPIVVKDGGGWSVCLPVPDTVVDGLGGPAQLRERLATILSSEPYVSGEISPHASARLTAQYDEFLQHFETTVANPTPIHINPGRGWSITVPITATVVAGLGGPARLRGRLAAVYPAEPQQFTEDSPHAAATVIARYDNLLREVEEVVTEPEH